jgi:acetyltransferase
MMERFRYVSSHSTTMKKNRSPSLEKAVPTPDFSRRPRRLNPEQIVEVKGFSMLKLRPIRLDDEGKMIAFHRYISKKSIFLRYFGYLGLDRRTSHQRLLRVCTNTPDVYSMVIEQPAHPRTRVKILAVGRLLKTPEPFVALFDTLIGDEAHVPKLGAMLVNRLINLARAFGFQMLTGKFQEVDDDAIDLCRNLGFAVHGSLDEGLVYVALRL